MQQIKAPEKSLSHGAQDRGSGKSGGEGGSGGGKFLCFKTFRRSRFGSRDKSGLIYSSSSSIMFRCFFLKYPRSFIAAN